jgi:hypothetical protein
MQTLRKIFKTSAITFLALFTAFVIYANWEKPPLSDQLNLKPIALSVYNLEGAITVNDSIQIANTLAVQRGITAATVNRTGQTISITYHPDEIAEADLKQIVTSENFKAKKIDFTAFKGPQCPVPSEYIDFVLNAKKTLCFR